MRLRIALSMAALAWMLAGDGHQGPPDEDVLARATLTPEERVAALSTLWSEAKFGFAYYDQVADGWDRRYQAFIPRVQRAKSDYEFYLELMRFYAHLRDGHSGVFWPSEFDEALGYPPLEIRKIDGRAVIFRVLRQTDELAREGIRPGLAVLEVDGRPVPEIVAYWRELKTGSTDQATDRLAYFRTLTGPRNSQVDVLLQEPGGAVRRATLTRSEQYFPDTNLEPDRLFAARGLRGGIGYFQANQMSGEVAAAFGEYIETNAEMRGLVVDLRYNGGGSDSVSAEMVGRLIEQPLDGQIYEVSAYRPDHRAFRQPQETVRTRQPRIAPSRGRRFSGPLVVLVGEQTHSAAEGGFVSVIRARPRTQLAGEPTAGSTGQPMGFRLPGGGLGAVCSRRTLAPDGSAFVGIGFQPDVRMALTWEDVYLGRDSMVDRAVVIVMQAIQADAAVIEAASRLADASRPYDHPSRRTFRRTPGRRERQRLGELSASEMDAVHALLRSVPSERGYHRATSIIRHDETLEASQPQEALGSGEYYVALYGDAKDDSPWARRIGGHHFVDARRLRFRSLGNASGPRDGPGERGSSAARPDSETARRASSH